MVVNLEFRHHMADMKAQKWFIVVDVRLRSNPRQPAPGDEAWLCPTTFRLVGQLQKFMVKMIDESLAVEMVEPIICCDLLEMLEGWFDTVAISKTNSFIMCAEHLEYTFSKLTIAKLIGDLEVLGPIRTRCPQADTTWEGAQAR